MVVKVNLPLCLASTVLTFLDLEKFPNTRLASTIASIFSGNNKAMSTEIRYNFQFSLIDTVAFQQTELTTLAYRCNYKSIIAYSTRVLTLCDLFLSLLDNTVSIIVE